MEPDDKEKKQKLLVHLRRKHEASLRTSDRLDEQIKQLEKELEG